MSSRVLRKLGLQGEKDLNCIGDDGSDTEADFSSSGKVKNKPLNVNRYDLLNQQSHSESEVKEDDDHETASSLNAQAGAIDLKDASRRKKKKKKKKPGKFTSNARSSEDNVEDEIERSVREVNEILGVMQEIEAAPSQSTQQPVTKGVLSIDHRSLNPNNEMRRLFGVKMIQNEQGKKRARSRGHIKSTWLTTPRDNWPQIGKPGLKMKLVELKDGIHTFQYEHSLNYRQVQLQFLEAVEGLNPDHIVAIINLHPYHVDGLLQLSELCRLSDDLAMGAELIERALYCLECAFHPAFNLSSGNCRLDYRVQENRSLFMALFKHMLYVGSKACHRTALELGKLLLSLDPENDPLAAILAIDFYALRSQQYDWLIRLFAEWEPIKNLSMLPNFAYSVAMAHFQLGEVETADKLLQKALISFPGVLTQLINKCGVKVDSRVSASTFFNDFSSKQSQALSQLEKLYVARSYCVWREAELLPWLEKNVHIVLDRVESGDPLVKEWEVYRLKRYHSTPRNIHRHVILSDIPEVTPILDETMQSPVLSFDPLPPPDSINLYQRPVRPRMFANANGLSIFFRSFIPTFTLQQAPSDEAGEEGNDGSAVDLRRSVASLLDAMRDLLSNIHLPEAPGDGDNEDDPDSDDA